MYVNKRVYNIQRGTKTDKIYLSTQYPGTRVPVPVGTSTLPGKSVTHPRRYGRTKISTTAATSPATCLGTKLSTAVPVPGTAYPGVRPVCYYYTENSYCTIILKIRIRACMQYPILPYWLQYCMLHGPRRVHQVKLICCTCTIDTII